MSFEALIYYTLKLTLIAHHRDSILERKAITKDHCWWCLQALFFSPSSWKTPHFCSHSPPPFSSFSQPCPQSQLSPAWNVNQPTDRVGKRFTLRCLMDRTVSFPKLIILKTDVQISFLVESFTIYHFTISLQLVKISLKHKPFSNSITSEPQKAEACRSKELTDDPCGCCKVL